MSWQEMVLWSVLFGVLLLILREQRSNYRKARRNAEAWQRVASQRAKELKWKEYAEWLEAQLPEPVDRRSTDRFAQTPLKSQSQEKL